MLQTLRLHVEIHDDHFPKDEEDRVWLAKVGKLHWVVLTKDKRIRYRPLEKEALMTSEARVFILVAGNLRGTEIAEAFRQAMPRIYSLLHSQPSRFIASVTQSGAVKIREE